jgi:hypothetical protein
MTNNNNSSNGQFNAAHILLRHPSSFMMDDRMMYQQDSKVSLLFHLWEEKRGKVD